MKKLAAILLITCAISLAPYAVARERHVLSDEGSKDKSFVAFREKLRAAVKAKDKVFVESMIAPQIATALGGETGKKAFLEQWENLAPISPFWDRMQKIIRHGARLLPELGEVHVPAVNFEDNHAQEVQGVIWNPTNQYMDEQVSIIDPKDAEPISTKVVKFKLKNGKTDCITASDIYSAYDEFATFKQVGGKWQMTWFGFAGL